MTKKGARVLVGFGDALSAVESAWMLRDAGHEVLAFARRGTHPALARARGVQVVWVTAPSDDVGRAATDLMQAVVSHEVDVVLPLDDESLWLCDRVASDPTFPATVAGPAAAGVAFALDKEHQIAVAASSGFHVPPTEVVRPGQSGNQASGTGPWMIKPALAVREQDGRLRTSTGKRISTLAAAEDLVADWQCTGLLQPLLHGVGEGVFGLATANGVVAWSGHRRIRTMNPAGSGASACRSIEPDPHVVSAAERLVADVGWSGLFMIEVLRTHDGTAWFMEVNGRSWGSMSLARRRGLLYPVWAVQDALEPKVHIPVLRPRKHATCRHVGREVVHLAMVARRPADTPPAEWPSLWQSTREIMIWRRGEYAYNLRRGELGVFLADTWATVAGRCRPAFRRLALARRSGRTHAEAT